MELRSYGLDGSRLQDPPYKNLRVGHPCLFNLRLRLFWAFGVFAGKFQYDTNTLEPGGQQRTGLDYGGVAFGAGGDHADFYLEKFGDEF
jgi:hypothetical protein